jgi:outer membrane biosynthesis protein TonB
MRQAPGIAAALVFFSCAAIATSHSQTSAPPVFHSAEVVSATGVKIPFNSVAVGMVELRVTISKTGAVKDIQVIRELASVTDQSIQSVKSWVFKPAIFNGTPIASQMTVSVVFCPYTGSKSISLSPIESESKSDAPDAGLPATPVEITTAQFPRDFNARTTSGTVVLQVSIGQDGQQGLVRVVKDIPPLTGATQEAIKDWKFAAASIGNRKITSNIVLAFAYRTPPIYVPN